MFSGRRAPPTPEAHLTGREVRNETYEVSGGGEGEVFVEKGDEFFVSPPAL